MKKQVNAKRFGSLDTISESARERFLGVACFDCGDEVVYSQTTFHRGHPEIRCRNCGKRGYMIREEREGGRLIWFRELTTPKGSDTTGACPDPLA